MAKRIKELEVEPLIMKKKVDCLGELKEDPGMGSKENHPPKGLKISTSLRIYPMI